MRTENNAYFTIHDVSQKNDVRTYIHHQSKTIFIFNQCKHIVEKVFIYYFKFI